MTDELRAHRYRRLMMYLGQARACDLLDKLQILALTNPEAVREFEAFLDRAVSSDKFDGAPTVSR